MIQSWILKASLLDDALIARWNLVCPASCFCAGWVRLNSVPRRTHQNHQRQLKCLPSLTGQEYRLKEIRLNIYNRSN